MTPPLIEVQYSTPSSAALDSIDTAQDDSSDGSECGGDVNHTLLVTYSGADKGIKEL